MFNLLVILLLVAGCTPDETGPNGTDTGDTAIPEDTDTVVDTDTDADDTGAGTDTGEEVVGGNCGGPEPPEDSLWECDSGGGYGYTWPTAGAPEDLNECLTEEGWIYEISPDGKTATLTNESDGRTLTCELDD